MTSTMLRSGIVAACLATASFCAIDAALGQDQETRKSRPRNVAAEKRPESANDGDRLERPEPNAMRVPEVSPEMLDVLQRWEAHTAKIKKLQVQHYRRVYNSTFFVEKLSEGELFFEAPDKGRINIRGVTPKTNVSDRQDPNTGNPYAREADTSEQWICDGKFMWQVNEAEKTIEEMPLPKEVQGMKIMDTPMPFLFGMPVDQARRRYDLVFSDDRPKNRPDFEIWLDVKPRLAQDAANWSQAKVILDSRTFLPRFVKMTDPSGNLETVYQFGNAKINAPNFFFKPQDFEPPSGYKKHTINIAENPNPGTCPSLIGLSAKSADKVLKNSGFEVKFVRGRPANRNELIYIVYEQVPAAATKLPKGATVELTVYDKATVQETSRPIGSAPKERSGAQRESSE